ncbi:MAG: DUF4168 domain-containing protein [Rivularia sp. (in: cyanobacteria)]
MKRITHSSNGIKIARMLSKSFLVGTLATLGFFASSTVLGLKADAQTPSIDNNEIVKYSRALLTIEQSRLQAFDEIKKISGGGQIPAIACNEPKTISALSTKKARDIATNYCQRSQTIVKDSGLSIEQFNNITLKLRNDASLKTQIHNTLIRLQKKPNSR